MSWTLTDPTRIRADYESGDARFARVRPYADGDTDFGIYLYVCDELCKSNVGVGIFDIAEWPWRAAFHSATPPSEAVKAAVAGDGTFG